MSDKMLVIGELLSEKQLTEVARIVNATRDPAELVQRITDYLETFGDELRAKEILPNYLAYGIVYALTGQSDLFNALVRHMKAHEERIKSINN